jgi:hypothetical protein
MAEYYVYTSCVDGSVYGSIDTPVDPELIGKTIYTSLSGESTSISSNCFIVTSAETTDLYTTLNPIDSSYSGCLDCYQQNQLAFFVESCNYPELSGPVNATQFSEFPIGKYYTLCQTNDEFILYTTQECLCFRVTGITEGYDFDFGITGPFTDCTCSRSSGDEYTECVICCDCGSTGSTVTQVSPPHPVWTDGYGTPVNQLNMVTLGGMNGLNN